MIVRPCVALLGAAALLATPAATSASDVHPIHVAATAPITGSWSGYSARILVRAGSPLYVWPGGYLSDGTFVQSGVEQPLAPGDPVSVFAWATHDTSTISGALPLRVTVTDARPGDWVTVRMLHAGARWSFAYRVNGGAWRPQGTFTSSASLASFAVVTEYWATGPQPHVPQVVRDAQVRATRWAEPEWSTAIATDSEQCGHERVEVGAHALTFRSAPGPCVGPAQ